MFIPPTSSASASSALLSRRDALRAFGLSAAALSLAPALSRASEGKTISPPASPVITQPGFYRFNIGAFEATAFSDGALAGPLTQLQLWSGQPLETLSADLKNAFLPPDKLRLNIGALLVRMGSETVLVDAGCGSLFGTIGGGLTAQLQAAGVKPEQITAVLLTHAHGDHMGGLLDADKKPVFKNARHFISRREFEFWTGSSPDLSGVGVPDDQKAAWIANAKSYLTTLKFDQIAAGEKLTDGLELIAAPGHTPGQLLPLFSSGDSQLLHVVDAVHHHVFSFNHPDWRFAFDADSETATATRKKILDRAAADRLRIFGTHLPFPGLGHVRILGKGRYEHVLEPWGTA